MPLLGAKAVLDACVLYPTVLRQVLLAVAARGLFRPLWSARILEEWARATRKLGAEAEVLARGEVAALRARWPGAEVPPAPGIEARLWLPDPADVHVLATAIAGSADLIVTFNAAHFPRRTLADEGIARQDPDQFLRALHESAPAPVAEAVAEVQDLACRLSDEALDLRALMKRAGLPRLGKRLAS
jgi:predicted nucleic acid-binding protein